MVWKEKFKGDKCHYMWTCISNNTKQPLMQLYINNALFVHWKECSWDTGLKHNTTNPKPFDFDIYAILNVTILIPSSYVL